MGRSVRIGTPLAAVAATAVLAAGCGGDSGATEIRGEQAPVGTVPSGGRTVEVEAGDNFFEPHVTEVEVGDTISWENEGREAHTVTKIDGPDLPFDDPIDPGDTTEMRFVSPGEIGYVCTIHADMAGVIRVTE